MAKRVGRRGSADGAHVTPELFRFFKELARNNNREWFTRNKDRYLLVVRDPLLDFVEQFGPYLEKVSPHYVADPRPVGGSLFRIYRDTRFAKDKRPYKTHAGLHFRHIHANDVHAPGFYLHLEPGEVFCGVGIWRPRAETARAVRDAIVANPERWRRALAARSFRARFRLDDSRLKRPPRGYDPDHAFVEDLKLKQFTAMTSLSERDACAPGFLAQLSKICKSASPFMEFLTLAVGLEW
jgi:uncharacterized protein (TIGR02453 family)